MNTIQHETPVVIDAGRRLRRCRACSSALLRHELFEHDQSFAREGLSPVLGYGARLWIAPSSW